MEEITKLETEKNTIPQVLANDIIPMWSVWRNVTTNVVWILVRKWSELRPYEVRSVVMLDPKREQTTDWAYGRFVDDINAGRLVRIIQN